MQETTLPRQMAAGWGVGSTRRAARRGGRNAERSL